MERLTSKDELGYYTPSNETLNCLKQRGRLIDRLATYENTELMPESVEALKLSMMGKAISEIKEFDGLPIGRLKELVEADKEGRVVVLPCKVGDTVYTSKDYIWQDEYLQAPQKGICEYFRYGLKRDGFEADGWYAYLKLENGKSYTRYQYAISTVYTTREEAEKVLEARNGNQ